MKYFKLFVGVFLLILLYYSGSSQNTKTAKRVPGFSVSKWTKAIINIECTSNFQTRFAGTAIFFYHNNIHYLLTARHVIADSFNPDSNKLFKQIYLVQNSNNYIPTEVTKIRESYYTVERFPPFLMNYEHFFTLSDKNTDLGIIDLEHSFNGVQFCIDLYNKGYSPLKIQDFDTTNSFKNNQEIYTVGFPQESYKKNETESQLQSAIESSITSLPTITRGRIRNYQTDSKFFEPEIFVYKGYSGGPIISNNRVIGINSRIMTVNCTDINDSKIKYIELRPKMVKAKHLIELVLKYESDVEKRKVINPGLFRNLDHLRIKYPKT